MNLIAGLLFRSIPILLVFILLVVYCRKNVRKRWERLASLKIICSPSMLDSLDVQRVVSIDFGYGNEIWLLATKDLDIDRKQRIFRNSMVFQHEAEIPKSLKDLKEEIGVRF